MAKSLVSEAANTESEIELSNEEGILFEWSEFTRLLYAHKIEWCQMMWSYVILGPYYALNSCSKMLFSCNQATI